jgi:hypothetical protein
MTRIVEIERESLEWNREKSWEKPSQPSEQTERALFAQYTIEKLVFSKGPPLKGSRFEDLLLG